MLILPLHRPLTRENFPFATMLLVLANVLVFFGWQWGDQAALAEAQGYYEESGLGRLEVSAYRRHVVAIGDEEARREFDATPQAERMELVAGRSMLDDAFVSALRGGALFDDARARAQWQSLREPFDEQLGGIFTLRHILRSSEVDPWRMLASAFLHGDAMHLLGNMVFLVALGLLVEGALGPARFLGVYLLGALGASAASLAWRWGEVGGGLGASGAVAALMGAFCVVWGRQPVRFFYWFGVVFDYVRAPAIWLLPAWLGWELYNLLANDHLGIGFDAHAGGIVCGATLGAALVWLGQVRGDFIRDEPGSAAVDDRWTRAQALLGGMRLAEAEGLLQELAREQPENTDVQVALYKVARNGRRGGAMARHGIAVLASGRATAVVEQEVLSGLDQAGVAIDSALRVQLARGWLAQGALDAAEAALAPVSAAEDPVERAQLWFQLGLGYRDAGRPGDQRRALETLLDRYPAQPQAAKARFLLDDLAGGGAPATT